MKQIKKNSVRTKICEFRQNDLRKQSFLFHFNNAKKTKLLYKLSLVLKQNFLWAEDMPLRWKYFSSPKPWEGYNWLIILCFKKNTTINIYCKIVDWFLTKFENTIILESFLYCILSGRKPHSSTLISRAYFMFYFRESHLS